LCLDGPGSVFILRHAGHVNQIVREAAIAKSEHILIPVVLAEVCF